jgi:hypothetical protein
VVGAYGHCSGRDDAAVSRNDVLQVVGNSLDGGGAVVLEDNMRRGWWSAEGTLHRKTVIYLSCGLALPISPFFLLLEEFGL